MGDPPSQRLSDVLSDASHAPELSTEELSRQPRLVTPHLMRLGAPVHKAVAWVLSGRFVRRLLAAQRARPFYGPVDVWVWRVRHEPRGSEDPTYGASPRQAANADMQGFAAGPNGSFFDGGPVRAYAPLLPWVDEDDGCSSHHQAAPAAAVLRTQE